MSDGRQFGRVLRLGSVRRDVEEELAHHFESAVEDLVAGGLSRQDAEAEAERRFGDVSHYRSQLEGIDRQVEVKRRWRERADAVRQSVAYAVRSLARSPALAIGVILTFALGIGANVTMYGVVERLLLRPPEHIVDADQVKRLYVSQYVSFMGRRFTSATLSYPDFVQLRSTDAFADLAAWGTRTVTVGEGLEAVEREAVDVTGNFFRLLGVQPALGRFFTEEEDRIGGPQQAVLGWQSWQRDFAGAADVVGRTIDFGYGAYEIVGVAPQNFTGMDLAAVDVWLPFHVVAAQTMGTEWREHRGWQFFEAVARLKPGVAVAAAEAEATSLYTTGRSGTEFAEDDEDPTVLLSSVLSARGPEAPAESVVARLLLVVSAIVLIIASLNVANLLLARAIRQRREIAVRLALGISRRRLIGQIMLEGMLLAFAGGVAALLLAAWGGAVIGRVLLPNVAWEGGVNVRIVVVAAALSVFAGVAAALIPALQATRAAVGDALRQAGAGGVTRSAARTRAGLALVQTALSVLLLVGAGLFVRSLDRVRDSDFGFDPHNLVYSVPRPVRGAISDEEMSGIMERGRARLAQLPGVSAVGTTNSLPFHSSRSVRVRAEGVDSMPTPATGGPYVFEVSPGFLEAMALDLVAGRTLVETDAGAGQAVAVVNESMARALWPSSSPLGKCLYVGNGPDNTRQTRCTEIVGVVEDSRRQEIAAETTFQYYVPVAQTQTDAVARLFVVRVAEESPQMLNAVRSVIMELDPRIRYVQAEPMMNRIDPRTRSWQLGAAVFSIFGLLALAVAAIGLYSVLAFDVTQRMRELGVRSALGASSRALIRMIVTQSLRLTSLGVTIGVVVALLLVDRVEPMLFEIPPRDPVTFLLAVVTLHMVAALASSLPAWRASRVDPNIALRAE